MPTPGRLYLTAQEIEAALGQATVVVAPDGEPVAELVEGDPATTADALRRLILADRREGERVVVAIRDPALTGRAAAPVFGAGRARLRIC